MERVTEGPIDPKREAIAGVPTGVLLGMGSQSEEALKRMFEDLGVAMESFPADTPAEALERFDVVVGSGGANSVYDEDAPQVDARIFRDSFRPLVIGVCLSSQMLVHHNGGHVTPSHQSDNGTFGNLEVDVIDHNPMGGFAKIKNAKFVHSNGDYFDESGLPEHFTALAKTGNHVAAFIDNRTGNVGFQFHPELSDALGAGIVRDILINRGFMLEPKPVDQFRRMVDQINERAGDDDLIVGFSGGIDSNVVAEAVLASNVPLDKIHIIHLDLGVNRTENGVDESEALIDRFESRTGIRPAVVRLDPNVVFHWPVMVKDENGEAIGEYILSQQTDPELKRKVFAQIYANTLTDYIDSLGLDLDHTKLVQGTLYPDVIESHGKGKVKTHHNQSPIMEYLKKNNRTIDPAALLFKNDMRRVGQERGFEDIDWQRQPFPGPGLIPRIVCSDGIPNLPENAQEVWERAKELVGDEFGLVMAGFRTVGQKGDRRSYAWPLVLSGEPDWSRMSNLMDSFGNMFPKEVNRTYYITGDRVDGIMTAAELTKTHVGHESLKQLRPLDDFATGLLHHTGALAATDQVPVGLLPTPFGTSIGDRTVFLRPFRTPRQNSFLTGEAVLPNHDPAVAAWYQQVVHFALRQPGITRVAYDLSNKPGGSTEAE